MTILYWTGEAVIVFLAVFAIIRLADLLIMLIRYRMSIDEWRYPIEWSKFIEFWKRYDEEKAKHDD